MGFTCKCTAHSYGLHANASCAMGVADALCACVYLMLLNVGLWAAYWAMSKSRQRHHCLGQRGDQEPTHAMHADPRYLTMQAIRPVNLYILMSGGLQLLCPPKHMLQVQMQKGGQRLARGADPTLCLD